MNEMWCGRNLIEHWRRPLAALRPDHFYHTFVHLNDSHANLQMQFYERGRTSEREIEQNRKHARSKSMWKIPICLLAGHYLYEKYARVHEPSSHKVVINIVHVSWETHKCPRCVSEVKLAVRSSGGRRRRTNNQIKNSAKRRQIG